MDNITLNLNNLTEAERETLMALVKKGNEPKLRVWKPKRGEQYWSIVECGRVDHYTWCDDHYDQNAYKFGNVFSTKEIAEEEVKRNEIMVKWRRLSIEAGELENPWDGDHYHWFVDIFKDEVHCCRTKTMRVGQVCFPTKESIEAAIEEVGKPNIWRYVLGVGYPYGYQGGREAQEAAE